jgi:uncharacterized membrane protein YdcZ (DUF606 family)
MHVLLGKLLELVRVEQEPLRVFPRAHFPRPWRGPSGAMYGSSRRWTHLQTAHAAGHVLISLIGIFTGIIVVFGMVANKRLDRWTKWFLITTVLTSVTGFFFPLHGFTPAIGVGIISLIVLGIAIIARYPRQMADPWRWIYIVTAVIALYFNVFVLIVQSFQKIPALHALAPTQTEPPFKFTQLIVLALFFVLAIAAAIRFRIERIRTTSI